jgi:hypothetical protein
MRRRRDFRRAEKGYLDEMTEGGVDAGRGFGNSIERGDEESERRRGRKL